MSHACHTICTSSRMHAALTLRFEKITQHDTSKVLRLPHKMNMEVSKVLPLPWKMQVVIWKALASIAPVTQNDFRHFTRHVRMSRSAPATQSCSLTSFETSQSDHFCSTPHRQGHRDLTWTAANGCGRLRTQVQRLANNPQPPRGFHGNPCYAFGKKISFAVPSWPGLAIPVAPPLEAPCSRRLFQNLPYFANVWQMGREPMKGDVTSDGKMPMACDPTRKNVVEISWIFRGRSYTTILLKCWVIFPLQKNWLLQERTQQHVRS